jgi:hypothetical protein
MSYLMPTSTGIEHFEEAAIMLLESESNLNHIYRTVFDLRSLCKHRSNNRKVDHFVNHDLVDSILDGLFDVNDMEAV